MKVKKERLQSIIEYAQHAARLRTKPVAKISDHKNFALYEHDIHGLPGIRININGDEGEDEIWLTVERLKQTLPPDVASPILQPWVMMTRSPAEEPKLLEAVNGANLINAGTHRSPEEPVIQEKPVIDPESTITLSDYEQAGLVRDQFDIYLAHSWRPWAEAEKPRRKSIELYSRLFTLYNHLENGIVEDQIEIVWGVGLGIWESNGATVRYPLIGRLVELSINTETAVLEIRPRDVDARIEVDWYAFADNPNVTKLEKAAKDFFGKAKNTFSPFDHSTFEPLLRTAAAYLDSNGIYWPDETGAEDRTLPGTDNILKITDTWALFARPRTNNLFLQDLERLKILVEEAEYYPPAISAIVTDPEMTNPVVELPAFRGISASYHSEPGERGDKAQDLFFPKAFNEEQVRIVQLLDIFNGVVVQGPPGTGKTHTIANIICHYLAKGKRVLVTSMKDPALAVLQEQIPEEIRSLTISLLTSEQEGMKQFEHAINKIASEIQSLDPSGTERDIGHLEELIDTLHEKLAAIDQEMVDWARRNLDRITLDNEEIYPQDAALEVTANAVNFGWIPDCIGVGPEYELQFGDEDIMQLREARRILGRDIEYLNVSLPQISDFPDSKVLIEVHHDLSQFEKLKQAIEEGDIPALADSSQETIANARQLLANIEKIRYLQGELERENKSWIPEVLLWLRSGGNNDMVQALETLGAELVQAVESRKAFLKVPVSTPEGIELDTEILKAVDKLKAGKSPFGIKGLIAKPAQKKQLDSIHILGNRPVDANDWKHVAEYLKLLKRLRELALRWNALTGDIPLNPIYEDRPESNLSLASDYNIYLKIKELVISESNLGILAYEVFPFMDHSQGTADNTQYMMHLEETLRHHLVKQQLSNVWSQKEQFQKVLAGKTGRIITDLNRFFDETVGNPAFTDAEVQAKWSALMTELYRVAGLDAQLAVVSRICQQISASGAPRYAESLKKPPEGEVDSLLPDSWRKSWRLRRLETYLDSIDVHGELKRLAKDRQTVENDLSVAYRDIIEKQTWLKLSENASPNIRAALQAYLNAIQKIGRGKGVRAVRFRQNARIAASQANPAVPCWIMPHYRVSESLPAELGCFDLVIIDEASQSDLTALPALFRAQKVLIVGDDKQVSPADIGLEEKKIQNLMERFLSNQVNIYRDQMSPANSIYDLFKVVFAESNVMLKEHFRCVGPIIEYSKREFYNHELRPLRMPKQSERLDPPLVDVFVKDGYRKGDVNLPEARFIVDEIKKIVSDPAMEGRSIGVVSLLGDKQALMVWERLTDELGPETIQRYHIACGNARTFQGKERDIMFLSMVSARNEVGAPLIRDIFEQRFNVAASRARDRMYLVRSIELADLSDKDLLRRNLINHFAAPFARDEVRTEDLRKLCESPFECEIYDELTQRGYLVTPQVRVGQYRIDMVVEGHNDTRLAIECDGDKYHGPNKWLEDMTRERNLRRAGWGVFWRCFASNFIRRREDMLDDLFKTLTNQGIEPIGAGGSLSVNTEHRIISSASESVGQPEISPVEKSVDLPSLTARSPVLSVSISKSLSELENARSSCSKNMYSQNDLDKPGLEDRDTTGVPAVFETDQEDSSDTIESVPIIDTKIDHVSDLPISENGRMQFELKRDKETPGTWRFKGDNDIRPLMIYLTKEQVTELGDPDSIIVTVKSA